MPFEVKPIKGPDHYRAHGGRTTTEVVADIQAFYDHAAELGGRVVAGHTVGDPRESDINKAGGLVIVGYETLYLVAELPDAPDA